MAIETRSRQAEAVSFGHFTDDGAEFVITTAVTPRPWVNVLANDRPGYGIVVSQAGGGYSWLGNAELNRITLWHQDMVSDDRGKFFYIRDLTSGTFWSAGYQPVRREPDSYECRHGAGYTTISQQVEGIESKLTAFVPPGRAAEVWILELTNRTQSSRELSVTGYLEWCLGTAHDTHREFHKTFLETQQASRINGVVARKRLWGIANEKGQGWNRNWDGVAFHSCSSALSSFDCDRESFIGVGRTLADPAAMHSAELAGSAGKWGDAASALQTRVKLDPGRSQTIVFTIGWAEDAAEAESAASEITRPEAALRLLDETRIWWRGLLDEFRVKTQDPGLNAMMNTWLPYQAMAGRIWGRSGYYQPGGAYGFRDQLQDSHIFMPRKPELALEQIRLHARHQFIAGNVFHWWQPITETGAHSRYSDDLLWLPFVLWNYIVETGDHSSLELTEPYVDGEAETLAEHCFRAIDLALSRRSERGLPLIGEGDWNDGLSAVGWDGKGESIWVAMFLGMILPVWADVAERSGDTTRAVQYRQAVQSLRKAVNQHGWDGQWYMGATCDDGSPVGSSVCDEGKIMLNPQTWSVISGFCPESAREGLMDTTRRMLYSASGPCLLRPAYTRPDSRIGYLTRYAPGVRENGGIYVHAATWAIWAECLMGNAEGAWDIFRRINPADRMTEQDRYLAEPYVTPGNVDGPDSPHHGRAGWTWYTGSASWLFKVAGEWLLGVRPEPEGLRIDPRLPEGWDGFELTRLYRGSRYHIRVSRPEQQLDAPQVTLDGKALSGSLLPPQTDGADHEVTVLV